MKILQILAFARKFIHSLIFCCFWRSEEHILIQSSFLLLLLLEKSGVCNDDCVCLKVNVGRMYHFLDHFCFYALVLAHILTL